MAAFAYTRNLNPTLRRIVGVEQLEECIEGSVWPKNQLEGRVESIHLQDGKSSNYVLG